MAGFGSLVSMPLISQGVPIGAPPSAFSTTRMMPPFWGWVWSGFGAAGAAWRASAKENERQPVANQPRASEFMLDSPTPGTT